MKKSSTRSWPSKRGADRPHRENRKLKTAGRPRATRQARRWLVERYFAWLQWKRRICMRLEYYASNFLGRVELASITMLLKRI